MKNKTIYKQIWYDYNQLLAKYGFDIKGFCIEKVDENNYEMPAEFKRPLFMIMQSYLVNYHVKNKHLGTARFILTGVWL